MLRNFHKIPFGSWWISTNCHNNRRVFKYRICEIFNARVWDSEAQTSCNIVNRCVYLYIIKEYCYAMNVCLMILSNLVTSSWCFHSWSPPISWHLESLGFCLELSGDSMQSIWASTISPLSVTDHSYTPIGKFSFIPEKLDRFFLTCFFVFAHTPICNTEPFEVTSFSLSTQRLLPDNLTCNYKPQSDIVKN